jgi:hypothetical protein
MGQDSAAYNRNESIKLQLPYMHVLTQMELSRLRQL